MAVYDYSMAVVLARHGIRVWKDWMDVRLHHVEFYAIEGCLAAPAVLPSCHFSFQDS